MNATTKKNVYQIVTDKIIEKLGQGFIPWRKPWVDRRQPFNLVTKKVYRGINALLLGFESYQTPAYLTFNQVRQQGGSVLKGEKAHLVVFWMTKMDDTDKTKEPKRRTILRYYQVFNVAQCANLPVKLLPPPIEEFDPIELCEEVLYHMPKLPHISHGGNKASYNPVTDIIHMPPKEWFNLPQGYYGTLYHELVHSTGHESRIGRKGIIEPNEYGSIPYSKEELAAEIGSSFLQSLTGIAVDDFEASAAYIQSWIQVLQNDSKFIIHASSQAQKAVDYILNEQTEPVEKKKHKKLAA